MSNLDDGRDPAHIWEVRMSTLVFLDLEATGLLGPAQRPRITELCLLAVHREDITSAVCIPRVVNKLTLCLNPKKPVQMMSSQITGLYNDNLERQKEFSEETALLLNGFLSHLEQPVCLIAHYGNGYDFPLLKAELSRLNQTLRKEIYCVDSLEIFRSVDCLELVRNYSSNHTATTGSTGIPVQYMSDYSTPKKSRTAIGPASLKRKSPEPEMTDNQLNKQEKCSKRTLVFKETEKHGQQIHVNEESSNKVSKSEETKIKPKPDSKTQLNTGSTSSEACTKEVSEELRFSGSIKDDELIAAAESIPDPNARSTKSDTFKTELLEEFAFSESIEDDELIVAADKAELSIFTTDDANNSKQDHSETSEKLTHQTKESANGLQSYCHNEKYGDDVMYASGYSVCINNKTKSQGSNSLKATVVSDAVEQIHEKSMISTSTTTADCKTINKTDNGIKDFTISEASITVHNKTNERNSPISVPSSSTSLLTSIITSSPELTSPLNINKPEVSRSGRGSPQSSNLSADGSGNNSNSTQSPRKSYKLVEVYKRLYGQPPTESHRAEDDCVTLLKCVCRTKDFVRMVDKHADLFLNIKPGY